MARKKTRGAGGVYKRGPWYWITYSVKGKRRREPAETKIREEALALLARRKSLTGNLAAEKVTVGDLLQLVKDEHELLGRSSAYIEALRIAKHLQPALGETRAAEITSSQIDGYIKKRLAVAEPSTVNRELALIRRAFNLGYRADPPIVSRVPHIRKLTEDNVREGFLEDEAYPKLLGELPEDLKFLFVFDYHYGMRKGAALEIQWPWVDLKEGFIRIPQKGRKNRKPKPSLLPIYGDVREYLERQPRTSSFVFARSGKRIKDFRASWKAACERAGVSGLLFHDLRRTAARNMRRAEIDEALIMRITGHKTTTMFRRYDIRDDRDMGTAGGSLDKDHKKRHGNDK